MTSLFGTRLPLVAAPMAGGGSSPELIKAATAAGAFAFLPGGYVTSTGLAREIAELKAAGLRFGVNLFKVSPTALTPAVTVTTVDEARAAAAQGVDLLVVQGSAAGGHGAVHDPARELTDTPTPTLVREVAGACALPLIAGGGVDGPRAVSEILAAGARAVAVGTLLLRSHESGASRTHKDALADPRFTETVLTRAFTGRPARGLLNGFIARHEATAPLGYPAVHHLTAGLRRAAAAAGDPDRVHLWAGTGFRAAAPQAAATLLTSLVV